MSREFKPGDVAMVAYDGQPERLMLRAEVEGVDGPRSCWIDHAYRIFADQNRVQSIRPLVVLDLSDAPVPTDLAGRNEPQKLVSMLRETADNFFVPDAAELARKVADQIEAQIAPPKPEEPQGFGAVVEDAEGMRWVRTAWQEPWEDAKGWARQYAEISAVRVLSEGVTE